MKISVSRTALLIITLPGIVLAIAMLLSSRVALAELSKPALSILPAEVSLAQNESTEVTLIASMPVSGVLTATLTSLSADDYAVSIQPQQTIAHPSGDVRFTAWITRTSASRSPGQALFALQYAMSEAGGALSTHLVTATLPIANGSTVSPVLTISLQTVTNTLLDRRSRSAFLVLNNDGDSDVRIDGIRPLSEQFVGLEFTPPLTFPLTVAAQRSVIVPLTIAARDQVQPGSWFVLVQVDSSWERGKRRYQASQVIRSDLDVGVYAENDVLKALSLPILLFLPGAIFVWVFSKLRSKPVQAQAEAKAEVQKPELAALRDSAAFTVIASIVIVIIYRFFGGIITQILFGVNVARDITLAYGFVDIASIVILAGILAGVLAALIISASRLNDARIKWLADRKKRAEALTLATFTLQEGDKPIEVLQKMARNKYDFSKWEGKGYKTGYQVYLLLPDKDQQDKVWIVPPMEVKWLNEPQCDSSTLAKMVKDAGTLDGLNKLIAQCVTWSQSSPPAMVLDWADNRESGKWPRSVARTEAPEPMNEAPIIK